MSEWQPIDTVPKNRWILLACDTPFPNEKIIIGKWTERWGCFQIHIDGQPIDNATHWMPLPDLPS